MGFTALKNKGQGNILKIAIFWLYPEVLNKKVGEYPSLFPKWDGKKETRPKSLMSQVDLLVLFQGQSKKNPITEPNIKVIYYPWMLK